MKDGFESAAFCLISPPNFGSSGGSCLPLSVVVAWGEPGVPVISWADADKTAKVAAAVSNEGNRSLLGVMFLIRPIGWRKCLLRG